MPHFDARQGLRTHYRDECFADAWAPRETALLLHGNAESGEAWNGWMPSFGRRFRVIRPDMRGFGRSTPMPRDFGWSLDGLVDDVTALLDHLALDRVHVVAAKVAGPIAIRLAARQPARLRSLTLLGTIVSGQQSLGDRHAAWLAHIEAHGVESWARWTMSGRLGEHCPPAMMEGWAKLMGATPLDTQLGFIGAVPALDVTADLPRVACPTLVVTTDASGLGSVEATRDWQARIPGSEFMVVPGDSYHVAATHPEACAAATIDFIRRRAG
ncbi:MAG TPA: alpha/beta fold hydrolase [Roseomonas sp.]|jgi:pimeloyl-ACP methyl ester carboxylesterase